MIDVHKKETSAILYLPPWTLKELKLANKMIPVCILDDELQRRFNYYGGVARACLQTDNDQLGLIDHSFSASITKIKSEQYFKN